MDLLVVMVVLVLVVEEVEQVIIIAFLEHILVQVVPES
jgi:hypothetical protein